MRGGGILPLFCFRNGDFMTMIKTPLPNIDVDSGNVNAELRKTNDHLMQLREELDYVLRHIDLRNFSEDGLQELALALGTEDGGGTVVADGVLTDSLYASMGDIADLTVDRISTSKKIYMYLKGDTKDDNYFEGYGKGIYWVQGVVNRDVVTGEPIAVQLKNRYNQPIYWQKEIFEVVGGIPFDEDGNKVLATTKNTGIPVMVYDYTKNVKLKIEFWTDVVTGNANPRITLGIGTDTTGESDAGKADIEKTAEGLSVRYVAESGEPYKLVFKNDGIYQVRTDGESKLPFMYIRDTTPPDTMGRDGDVCFVKL